jgi:hypothetical protein
VLCDFGSTLGYVSPSKIGAGKHVKMEKGRRTRRGREEKGSREALSTLSPAHACVYHVPQHSEEMTVDREDGECKVTRLGLDMPTIA